MMSAEKKTFQRQSKFLPIYEENQSQDCSLMKLRFILNLFLKRTDGKCGAILEHFLSIFLLFSLPIMLDKRYSRDILCDFSSLLGWNEAPLALLELLSAWGY